MRLKKTRSVINKIAKELSLDTQVLKKIAGEVEKTNQELMEWNVRHKAHMSTKLLSEVFGNIFAAKLAEVLTSILGYEVRTGISDNDPDTYFTKIGKELEVKVTATDQAWRGGTFSKRPSLYLLISWGRSDSGKLELFVALTNIQTDEWEYPMKNQKNPNYYASKFKKSKLFEKYNKGEVIFLLGKLEKKGRGIKMIREVV